MKTVKWILIILGGLITIALIIPLFVKKDYAVERQITIHQPKEKVFAFIKLLKNQDQFSVWASMDPKMEKFYRGEDGKIGFVSGWKSNDKKVGRGEQEILSIDEGNQINFELRFYEPFEATETAYFKTTSRIDSTTVVSWGFNGGMQYPMNAMMLFMDFEEMIGKDFDTGLAKLKSIMEAPTPVIDTTNS